MATAQPPAHPRSRPGQVQAPQLLVALELQDGIARLARQHHCSPDFVAYATRLRRRRRRCRCRRCRLPQQHRLPGRKEEFVYPDAQWGSLRAQSCCVSMEKGHTGRQNETQQPNLGSALLRALALAVGPRHDIGMPICLAIRNSPCASGLLHVSGVQQAHALRVQPPPPSNPC